MRKQFDATLKGLVALRPPDWPAFLGVPARSVEVVDADVSTVSAAADKVLLVHADDGDCIEHLEFQAGPDASVPRRMHGYSALLEDRHELPVESVVILLSPKANLSTINGVYKRSLPRAEEPYLQFRYRVIRVWEQPVERVLSAGISVLPLAPISAVSKNELPAVIERMKKRLDAEADPQTVAELWTATKVNMGLCYESKLIDHLLRGVRAMKESTTYQAIMEEGHLEGLREDIRRLGERKFHVPLPDHVKTILENTIALKKLQGIHERILVAEGWEDLIVQPAKPRTSKRRAKK